MNAAIRLGAALAGHVAALRHHAADSAFVRLDAIPEDVALAMSAAWPEGAVRLAIAGKNPAKFAHHSLDASGTSLRNESPGGVCLVVCEGLQLDDDQSLTSFEQVAPADLLASADEIKRLADVEPSVPLEGVARDARSAIGQLSPAERPSALRVCAFFDALASGRNPKTELPALGGFRDDAQGERSTSARIRENLQLAGRLRSDEMQRHGGLGDIRQRARRVLARRNDHQDPGEAADLVMRLLHDDPDALLAELSFDEAREILERKQQVKLTDLVAQELDDYRRQRESDADDPPDIPWERYRSAAAQLASPDHRQEAAVDLLSFDDSEQRQCFGAGTRKKLDRLLKDRIIRSRGAPESGLLAGALALDGGLGEITLAAPEPESNPKKTRRSASRALTLSCARLRLKKILADLQDHFGIKVDPSLLLPADAGLWDEIFEDAELHAGNSLETVRLRLHAAGESRDVLVMEWRPDLDDLATLRAAIVFSDIDTLRVEQSASPTLSSFCADPAPVAQPVAGGLQPVAAALRTACQAILADGLSNEALDGWVSAWGSALADERAGGSTALAEGLALAGTVCGANAVGMTPLAPLKAEWLSQQLDALWSLLFLALHEAGDSRDEPLEDTAQGTANATASHYPAHLRVSWSDRPLLPTSETRLWATYGGPAAENAQHGGEALRGVLRRLLQLQPEAGGHLRCIAAGPGAADLLVREGAALVGTRLEGVEVRRIEIFCIDSGEAARPLPSTLAAADDRLAGIGRDSLELRYLPSLEDARAILQAEAPRAPAVHLALVCGITGEAARLDINTPEVDLPARTTEALFVPRTSIRPRQARRMLLAPPAATDAALAWLELMHALEDLSWREEGDPLRVPELRTIGADLRGPLRAAHELALWVATLDPYATRDSLQSALGDDVAILHQERRLGGDSPLALVISQKSGGAADNAIGRSLQAARIIADRRDAVGLGVELRKVASQGYGILALEAATTGAGINELVGHVVAFSMLAARTTPWPLPPGCKLVLVSLDDYKHWFPGKRGDLLVLALDEQECGVHGAIIEVKARRSDASIAATDALDQLRQTLRITRWAGYPDPETIHSRLWLNRIAEAALAVARESNLKLTEGELAALEQFRVGTGTLEWAGIGLVFGPGLEELERDRQEPLAGDLVPITISAIDLTADVLRSAVGTNLADLRTVEAERTPLTGGRVRRRPERASEQAEPGIDATLDTEEPEAPPTPEADTRVGMEAEPTANPPSSDDAEIAGQREPESDAVRPDAIDADAAAPPAAAIFEPPILGWDTSNDEAVYWRAAGEGALSNGHMEIWGSSGAGKTQFVMALLSQLAATSGTHFGIADFKNDYDGDFPAQARAEFIDLWDGAPFNPLALPTDNEREIRSAVIELRDIVDVATQSFTRMGIRQKGKLKEALEEAYAAGLKAGHWPTMATLDALLDDDLKGIIGDLTSEPIFGQGRPLGDAVGENTVFGLSRIPGNGLTTVLAAGFILSALQLRMQGLAQVANTVRYAIVVDEAHRVSAFKAVDTMIREGRSKGLAVILATQQPGDLPEVVATNAQSRICFRLPDAAVASAAARRLDPNDRELAEQIRTLGSGEAFVMLGGQPPKLLRMAQNYRDRPVLGLPA